MQIIYQIFQNLGVSRFRLIFLGITTYYRYDRVIGLDGASGGLVISANGETIGSSLAESGRA
jgi:hypothetical protein